MRGDQIGYLHPMSALAFDTHKFVKDLTKAGMSDSQAEVLANHYAGLLNDRLATKDDLELLHKDIAVLRKDTSGDIAALRKDMEALRKDMEALRTEVKSDLKHLEERLNHRMMITVLSAQLVTIVTICTVTTYLLSIN